MRRRVAGGAALCLAAAGVSYALILNLCHAVFRCGCRSWWSGAAEMCNVHREGVRHCPWCSVGDAGFWLAFALLLMPQFILAFWPARLHPALRVALVLAMFPLAGSVVAVSYGLSAGYWK
jgi:hypothetical protein